MSFGEYIRLGACHGGYVVGLIAALGTCVMVVGLVIALVGYLVNPEKKEDDK